MVAAGICVPALSEIGGLRTHTQSTFANDGQYQTDKEKKRCQLTTICQNYPRWIHHIISNCIENDDIIKTTQTKVGKLLIKFFTNCTFELVDFLITHAIRNVESLSKKSILTTLNFLTYLKNWKTFLIISPKTASNI